MANIKQVDVDAAEGELGRLYLEARRRAGRVWNIVKIMGLRPHQLEASMAMYRAIMFGESGLTRAERELLATVTSSENACFY